MKKQRRAVRMTDPWVKAVRPEARPVDWRDTDRRGLYLRVEVSGRKTWVVRYTFSGTLKRFKIGPYPEVLLSVARPTRSWPGRGGLRSRDARR